MLSVWTGKSVVGVAYGAGKYSFHHHIDISYGSLAIYILLFIVFPVLVVCSRTIEILLSVLLSTVQVC